MLVHLDSFAHLRRVMAVLRKHGYTCRYLGRNRPAVGGWHYIFETNARKQAVTFLVNNADRSDLSALYEWWLARDWRVVPLGLLPAATRSIAIGKGEHVRYRDPVQPGVIHQATCVGRGRKNGEPILHLDDGHWCYFSQVFGVACA
jgi:hypothetical protein